MGRGHRIQAARALGKKSRCESERVMGVPPTRSFNDLRGRCEEYRP
jgi:hypothetical protein